MLYSQYPLPNTMYREVGPVIIFLLRISDCPTSRPVQTYLFCRKATHPPRKKLAGKSRPKARVILGNKYIWTIPNPIFE